MRPLAEIESRVNAGEPVTRPEAEALVRAVDRRCRGHLPDEAREIIGRLLADGQFAEARALDANARTPCGADVNALLLTLPLDGEEHRLPCPQCGTMLGMATPRVMIEERVS